ncbi:hypothetical protein FRC03_007886 [Tulasnella sp. 419]|nr:hypothetical protein FRC03_007886 [Tulasnella sp. 419]
MTAAIDLSHLDLTNKVEFGEQSSHGGYSDIFQGTYLADDGNTRQVAVKALRLRGSSGAAAKERLLKHFYREVLLWQRFQHPNITPLLGYMLPSNKPPALVSPWYIHGDVLSYLELHSDADRNALALDVLKGLEYLHSFPVAHGDLKAENVLVDGDKRASLCDFGMSQFLDEATQITGFTTTNAHLGGTDRYLCPELLEDRPKTTATDIWALGCLLVQILADRIPYQHITRREAVLSAIVRGNPPSTNRPDAINPSQWDYISKCWNVEPEERPPVSKLWLCFQPKSSTAVEVTTGEENENTKYQVRARLYQLDTRGTYKERGTGVLKINVRKSDERGARIVMRTDGVYRLILNVLLFPGIHFRVGQDPRYIRLTSIEYGVPINYAIRVSNAKIAQELYDNIESCIPPRLGEEDVWMDEI